MHFKKIFACYHQESIDFAKTNNLKYTYFISGVYFLLNSKKNIYNEPVHGVGKSDIGFGGSNPEGIRQRVGFVKEAFEDGNEIGSHANGHYDGTRYSFDSWDKEFAQFYDLILNVFKNNGMQPEANPFPFDRDNFKGFRAPLLGQNSAMYQVLKKYNYTYDTSKISTMNYWPEQKNGIWNFPLAEVKIAGTAKSTISMDYNFYDTQSKGKPMSSMKEEFKKEMLNTYINYFNNNYHGNRAPVHIGHHFSKWNGGAYWEAMQEFAKSVCGLPEVKCVTYKELEAFMESKKPSEIAAYRRGLFPKYAGATRLAVSEHPIEMNSEITLDARAKTYKLELSGDDREAFLSAGTHTVTWSLNGNKVQEGSGLTLSLNQKPRPGDQIQVSITQNGKEILTETRDVQFLSAALSNQHMSLSRPHEEHALQGDLPEAHKHESGSSEMGSSPDQET